MRKNRKVGFTLVELIVVMAIVAILASASVVGYRSYRESLLEQEANATLELLSKRAETLIRDWGISEKSGVAPGCLEPNPKMDRREGPRAWDKSGAWARYGLTAEGLHRWSYQLCFGLAGSSPDDEAYIISAHRLDNAGRERVMVLSSDMDKPIKEPKSAPMALARIGWRPSLLSDN